MKRFLLALLILLLGSLFLPSPVLSQGVDFNIHSLTNESDEFIECTLDWLAANCGTDLVRLWGYDGTLGVNGYENLERVLNAAPAGMRFIVALEDFAFGPPANNPGAWYSQAMNPGSDYYEHVRRMITRYGGNSQILVWELLNEPHCRHDAACFENFLTFTDRISTLIRQTGTSAYISPGIGPANHLASQLEFERLNNLPNITANSCHYYSNEPDGLGACLVSPQGGINFFYIGEAGYVGNSTCGDGNGCTTRGCTNCCSAGVLQQRAGQIQTDRGNFSAVADAFLIWQFSPPQNPRLSCDSFSVFPGDPVCAGNETFTCSPTLTKEPITITGPSNVCSDFQEDIEEESQLVYETPVNPEDGGVIQALIDWFLGDTHGEVALEEAKFPDFEGFQESMTKGLAYLLPMELSEEIDLPGDTTMRFNHKVQGVDENGNYSAEYTTLCDPTQSGGPTDQTPRGEVEVPKEKWGKLTGGVRGLCGFLSLAACEPTDNFQFKLREEDYFCDVPSCEPGGADVPPEELDGNPIKRDFSLLSMIQRAVTTIIETIGDIIRTITNTTQTTYVQVLSRAKLAGGKETADNSEFLYSFLPPGIISLVSSSFGTQAIADEFDYTVRLTPSTGGGGDRPAFYYDLAKMRSLYCMQLCGSQPEGVPLDPICPSCDPNDEAYRVLGGVGADRTPCWETDPPTCGQPDHCIWDESINACHYHQMCENHPHIPHCDANGPLGHGCGSGEDPVCEDCSGLPDALYPDTDLAWCGGQGGSKSCSWYGSCRFLYRDEDNWEEDTYHWADGSPAPEYTHCYYAGNPTLVRSDGVGGCAGICNRACGPWAY